MTLAFVYKQIFKQTVPLHLDNFISFLLCVGCACPVRINEVTYRKLKIPLKVNCNLKSKTAAACVGIEVIVLFVLQL